MNRLIILGVVVLAAIYVLVSSIFVVNEREQAIVMRFGQITDVKTEPGLYFKLPTTIVDTVQIIEDRLLRYDVANMTLQVSRRQVLRSRRVPHLPHHRSAPVPRARAGRSRRGRSPYRHAVHRRAAPGLRTARIQRGAVGRAAADDDRGPRPSSWPNVAELGIEIVDVRILRTDLTQDVSAADL